MADENTGENSEMEIVGYLTQSGFTEEEIRRAIRETKSRDIDHLVNFIINTNEKKKSRGDSGVKQIKITRDTGDADKAADMSRKRREELERERLYREELIRQIEADMREKREKERAEDERLIGSDVAKTEDISDCKIKLWLGDGSSLMLGFSKEDTIEDLFRKAEAKANRKGINLFKMNHTTPIERSSKKLSETPGLYPQAVLFVEE